MRLPLRSILSNHCSFSIFHPIKPPTTTTTLLPLNSSSYSTNRKDKVLMIMGPTGSGKSRLSVDIATSFPAEIINSDKIQLYKGLNITTNKIPIQERLGVPHHLLGDIDSSIHGEFTPLQYRLRASSIISDIVSRNKLPLVVGGSNSLIYALLAKNFNPNSDVFAGSEPVCTELRYRCCFLWIHVSLPVLNQYLIKRVDDMLDSGMLDELSEFYNSSEIDSMEVNRGLRKAIGVPELESYFREEYGCDACGKGKRSTRIYYEEAVKRIKDNTCELAKIQMEKIQRLYNSGWALHRLDATDSFRRVLELEGCSNGMSWSRIWDNQVVQPSIKIVNRFLHQE